MGRGKTLIKQNEVMRVARGLLLAAGGKSCDIQIDLRAGVVRGRFADALERETASAEPAVNEWDSIK
jgi:hypothetical protein